MNETLNEIGFFYTKTDPGVWYWPAVKPKGFGYYEYIVCYVDDILCISNDPSIAIGRIRAVFKFKGDKIEHPKIYLGYQVGNIIVDGEEGWYMSEEKYVRSAVENAEKKIAKPSQHYPHVARPPSCLAIGQRLTIHPSLKLKG